MKKSMEWVHPSAAAREGLEKRAGELLGACRIRGEGRFKEIERLLVGSLIIQVCLALSNPQCSLLRLWLNLALSAHDTPLDLVLSLS